MTGLTDGIVSKGTIKPSSDAPSQAGIVSKGTIKPTGVTPNAAGIVSTRGTL